jgi:hypothetical protein
MIDYILDHIGEISSILSILGAVYAGITRSYNKLHKDIMEIQQECKESRARIDATGARIDVAIAAMNANTQALIKRNDDISSRVDQNFQALMTYITKR